METARFYKLLSEYSTPQTDRQQRHRDPGRNGSYAHQWSLLKGMPHQVLNERQDAGQTEIIARAGAQAMISVATNMAGREGRGQ